MFRKSLSVLFAAFCAVFPAASPALSAEDVSFEDGVAYMSITRQNVTAKKGAASESFRIPSNITVIERKDIEALNASSVADVLRFQQGVVVRDWTGAGKTVGIDLRGFGETGASNVLVLVNGRRTNNIDTSNVDWSQIPLSAVEKIEIIRGPSSVLYGDNATGGVINIITAQTPRAAKGGFSASAGSYNSSKLNIDFSGGNKSASYNVAASRNSTDGFRKNSGVTNTDLAAFLVFRPADIKTSVDFGYHADNFGLPGAVPETDWMKNEVAATGSPNDNAKTGDAYIRISAETPIYKKINNEFTVSYRNRISDSYLESMIIWGMPPGEERKTSTVGVANKIFFDTPGLGGVVAGVEGYFSRQSITKIDANDKPLPDITDLKKDTIGLYVTDDAKIMEKFYLSAGARYELLNCAFAETGNSEIKISSGVYGLSMGLSYLWDDKSSAYFKWASGYRIPKIDEYYSVGYYFLNTWYPGGLNASLLNQMTRTTELGLKKIFDKGLSGNISVFQTDGENEIYYNPAAWANENYKKTRRLGAELGVTANPAKNLTVRADYTYTDAKITEGDYKDSTVPAVPAHAVSLVNTLALARFDVGVTANYVGERYFINDQKNVSPKLEAFATCDAKVAYKMKDVKIFAGVNNIFDAKYAEYGVTNIAGTTRNYYPSPLRNFFGGVEIVF